MAPSFNCWFYLEAGVQRLAAPEEISTPCGLRPELGAILIEHLKQAQARLL